MPPPQWKKNKKQKNRQKLKEKKMEKKKKGIFAYSMVEG